MVTALAANVRVINCRDGSELDLAVYPRPNGTIGVIVAVVNLDPNPYGRRR